MISYTTINYSDIYAGESPTIGQLLEGINSKILVNESILVTDFIFRKSSFFMCPMSIWRYSRRTLGILFRALLFRDQWR